MLVYPVRRRLRSSHFNQLPSRENINTMAAVAISSGDVKYLYLGKKCDFLNPCILLPRRVLAISN